jgi:peptidoglycan/xylan/chitin deacetylase (PgdA/CDA1 family)
MSAVWHAVVSDLSAQFAHHWSPHSLPIRAKAPVVSFSFDDSTRAAATAGASLLREFGVRGTYFVAGSRMGRRLDGVEQFVQQDLIRLAEDAHEIGSHTFSHVQLPGASRIQIRDDIERNKDFVQRIIGDYTMSSFAYPYGKVSVSIKELLGTYFPICRGIWYGMNRRNIDFMNLKAVSLAPSLDHAKLLRLIDDAKATNGWIIFVTHDVSDRPSPRGCTPSELARVLSAVLERGIDVLPIKNAAGRTRFSQG